MQRNLKKALPPISVKSESIPLFASGELFQNYPPFFTYPPFLNLQMAPSSRASRKRASSDQLRDLANRNVRPAIAKSIAKSHQKSSGSTSERQRSPPLPIPTDPDDTADDQSEYEQEESATDIDEENLNLEEENEEDDHRRRESHTNTEKKIPREARMMAIAGSRRTEIMVVSMQLRSGRTRWLMNKKHGRRPPHKELKLQKSSPAPGERKHRPAMKQFTGSSSVVEDIDNDSQAGSGDRGESDVVSGKELAVL